MEKTRFAFAGLVGLTLCLAACGLSDPPSGTLTCEAVSHACPTGYYCHSASNTCWKNGSLPDGGPNGTPDVPNVSDGPSSVDVGQIVFDVGFPGLDQARPIDVESRRDLGLDGPAADGQDVASPSDAADLPVATPDTPGTPDLPQPDLPSVVGKDGPSPDLAPDLVMGPDVSTQGPETGGCTSNQISCNGVCVNRPATGAPCCVPAECAGTCQTCTGNACVAVKSADDSDSCAGTCDSAGACKAKKGQKCDLVAGGCIDTTTCSPENICCNQACAGSCMACDVAGSEGTCTAVASGAPHLNHTPCGTDSDCLGTCSAGQCSYPTKSCGTGATCSSDGQLVGASACALGVCKAPAAVACNNGLICSSGACKLSCGGDVECQTSHFCAGASCHLDAIAVDRHSESGCILLSDNTVRCWGSNTYGQLGNGSTLAAGQVVTVPEPVSGLTNVTAIGVGRYFACALISGGTVKCWGIGNYGQLGTGEKGNSTTPVAVIGLTSVKSIAVGSGHTCALRTDGTVWCWGFNAGSQLGQPLNFTTPYNPTPTAVAGVTGATAIAAGNKHSCALVAGGAVLCWGSSHTLGTGDSGGVPTPTPTAPSGAIAASAIACGDEHTCVISTSGSVMCWGSEYSGELGDGSGVTTTLLPVTALVTGALGLSAKEHSTCALQSSGRVTCWGQVISSATSGVSPTAYTPAGISMTGAKMLGGGDQSCVVMANGSVSCWGWDLAPSTSVFMAAPTAVAAW